MQQKVLAAGYSRGQFEEAQREWMKYGVAIHWEKSISDAVLELLDHNDYQLIILFCDKGDYLALLEVIRELAKAPILVIRPQYDGEEKILAINAGADEYIGWPETEGESVASGRALIRRSKEAGLLGKPPFTVLNCGELLVCVEQRKVFVCGKETAFTRHEFEFLLLLLKGAGRVYTHEQICGHIWGGEGEISGGALWNLVSRLRTKIACGGGDGTVLQTVRDVGYRIEKAKTA